MPVRESGSAELPQKTGECRTPLDATAVIPFEWYFPLSKYPLKTLFDGTKHSRTSSVAALTFLIFYREQKEEAEGSNTEIAHHRNFR